MKKLVLFLVLISFSSSFADVSFVASVNKNPVTVGERIQVVFALNNASGSGFKGPTFKGFSALSGPSQSQSTQWINGQTSSSQSFIYLIQADNEGKFTIEPASITVNGKRLTSNSITITVQKGSAKPPQKTNDEKNLSSQADDIIRKNLFIRVEVSKKDVYQGEQLVATYKLYIHPDLNIASMSPPKMPSFNGFWMQDLDIKELKFTRQVLDGVAYKAADLKKVVLIPQQTGNLAIDPMEIDFVVRLQVQGQRQSRDMFDDFFNDFRGNYKDFPFTAKSRNASLNVKALPTGAPAEFRGGVGNMQMKAWLDKKVTKANEAVTLKVQVSGSGNLKLVEPFALNLPPDIDSYEPKTVDNISVSASGVSGSKTFEYYLIPRNPGEYKIDPVKFAYFDLSSKKYVTLSSEPFILKVEKGSGTASSVVSGVNKEDVKYIGKDIRFIKTRSSGFSREGFTFFGSAPFYLWSLLPMFIFILFFLYKKRDEKLSGNVALLKNKKANSVAKKRLTRAKKYLEAKDEVKFYEEISKALWGYTSDKLGLPVSELTKDTAKTALIKRNVSDEDINSLMTTLDYSEFARFAPSDEKLELNLVYSNAASIIASMEGILK